MDADVQAVYNAALALPSDARAELADKLLASLDQVEIDQAVMALPREARVDLAERILLGLDDEEQTRIEAGWVKELQSRTKAVERGDIELIPAEEVFRQYRLEVE